MQPLPAACDGEIDWTLFSFSHGFRHPRAGSGHPALGAHPRAPCCGPHPSPCLVSACAAVTLLVVMGACASHCPTTLA